MIILILANPELQASRRLWVSGRRPISRLWRTATQPVEPQLIAAKALIVNYTFGAGTHFWRLIFGDHERDD
jgi:hypothetical protein